MKYAAGICLLASYLFIGCGGSPEPPARPPKVQPVYPTVEKTPAPKPPKP